MGEIADFLANMFENMKTSFIPPYDFNFALGVHIASHYTLLHIFLFEIKNETTIKEDINVYKESRLMKIYLLREDHTNYKIENGILSIISRSFVFEFFFIL